MSAPPIVREETVFGPGETGASAPRVPGVPAFVSNGSGTVTFSFDDMGNDPAVMYAFRVATYNFSTLAYAFQGYVASSGVVAATKFWNVAASWGNVAVASLTNFVGYSFAAKSRNETASAESDYSASSAVMNTRPDIDWGALSSNLAREVTGGNTIVDDTVGVVITGNEVAAAEESQTTTTEYYGNITATYRLKNNYAATSSVVVQFNETYVSPGTPGTWAAATEVAGGEGAASLTTSATGRQHVYVWNSYADAGDSELDASVYLRIIPYDAAATGSGSAAASLSSAVFGVNNRPAQITWVNSDGYTFDKDTTPVFRGIMPSLRGGNKGYPMLAIYLTSGLSLVASHNSVVSVAGWRYESTLNTWVNMTTAGIPDSAINGTNRVEYTVQAALDTDEYTINGKMGEVRDEG